MRYRIQQDTTTVEKVEGLRQDLKNICSHVFGEHKECGSLGYFKCSPSESNKNHIPQMKECGLLEDIEACMNRLTYHAHSLITNMDNNLAELYNSIVCKFVGGKRINYSKKGSYQTRCEAAALSFNFNADYYDILGINQTSAITRRYTQKLRKKRASLKKNPRKTKKTVFTADEHYGPDANPQPDLTDEQYEEKKKDFLFKLKKTNEEIIRLEKDTRGQAANPLWMSERICRLTASNFGDICKMKKSTSCANKIKNMLYSPFYGNDSTRYGQEHEISAIKQFEQDFGFKVSFL